MKYLLFVLSFYFGHFAQSEKYAPSIVPCWHMMISFHFPFWHSIFIHLSQSEFRPLRMAIWRYSRFFIHFAQDNCIFMILPKQQVITNNTERSTSHFPIFVCSQQWFVFSWCFWFVTIYFECNLFSLLLKCFFDVVKKLLWNR